MRNRCDEVDGKKAGQPRCFVSNDRRGSTKVTIGVWIGIVPVFVLLVTALAISRSREVGQPPLPLQTFARSSVSTVPLKPPSEKRATDEPLIRVNVTPGGLNSIQLELRGQSELTSLDPDQKVFRKLQRGAIVVTSTETGLKLDGRQYTTNRLEITPEKTPSIRVNGHLYRGKIRLFLRTDGQISAVNVLPVEEYLASVVDSEMPAKFPEAARQAQSIVARTYALYQREQADPNAVYDLFASQRSQKYLGVEYLDGSGRRLAGESDSSRRIVASTRGAVCQRHGKLFCTYYSAVCGGKTTNGQLVFKDAIDALQSVPCEWCRESPYYRWTSEIKKDDFLKRVLKPRELSLSNATLQGIYQETASGDGRIPQFKIDDGKRTVSLNGIEIRERLPVGTLSSPHFQIKVDDDRVIFEGRGHGHGVGFCQWGAKGQAEAGHTCDEIVRYYYSGCEIKRRNY